MRKGIYPNSKKLPNIKNNKVLKEYGIIGYKIKFKRFYCKKCKSYYKMYSINTKCKYCETKLLEVIKCV